MTLDGCSGVPSTPWRWQARALARANALLVTLHRGDAPASTAQVIDAWRHDAPFRRLWCGWLAALPFDAFVWELPVFTQTSAPDPFECVLIDAPDLDGRRPHTETFADHFSPLHGQPDDQAIAVFANLGRDGTMIAPCPRAAPAAYVHLARFMRDGPPAQREGLWRVVGNALINWPAEKPCWLSTAGGGVAWLHVRLDSWPKYYRHHPYCHHAS